MAEEYDETLRANLRRLSSIGSTIEETRDRPFKRIQALELSVVRLSEQLRTAAGREEVARLRDSIDDLAKRLEAVERSARDAGPVAKVEKELRSGLAAIEERVKGLDRSLRESVKKLSQIDSEIINELSKLQGLVEESMEGPPPVLAPPPRAPPAKPPPRAETPSLSRREELERERERILAQLGRATEEHGAGQLSSQEYEEMLRKGEERLAQIDGELERARE